MKYWEALKRVDYEDVLTRAFWTFLQGFIAVFLLSSENIIDLLFSGQWLDLYTVLIASAVGGLAAGLSALKTVIIEYTRKLKEL